MPLPVFISLEGGEGSGKSTQAERLYRRLQERGVQAILLREPGSTPLGTSLRNLLLSQTMSSRAELLLFLAARAQMVAEVVRPAMARGVSVVTDRYADSSVAYQGYGRRLGAEVVQELNRFATDGLMPHLTVLLDLPPEVGLRRVGPVQMGLEMEEGRAAPGRADVEGQRKFERQPLEFHKRVRQGYLKLAAAEPGRWLVVDAAQPVDAVHEAIWQGVRERLELD